MNLLEIRAECWGLAREVSTNDAMRLWSQEEMNRYINRVYYTIARETRCIRDSITPAICRIASTPPADLATLTTLAETDVWAAQDLDWYNSQVSWLSGRLVAPYSYPLDSRILEVEECKWSVSQWKLTKVSVEKWRTNPWWEQVVGMPTEYCTDGDNGRLFVNFRAVIADTMKLVVRRLPLLPLVEDTDIPEIRLNYHHYMKNGVLWQMFNKRDVETFDLGKASEFQLEYLKDLDDVKQQEAVLDHRLRVNQSLDGFR